MIAFLLLNWRWLVPTAGAAILGIWLGFAKLEIADLKSAAAKTELRIEKQKTDAANQIAESEKKNADLQDEYQRKLTAIEGSYSNALTDINDKDRRIASLIAANGGLRDKAGRCGNGRESEMPGSTVAPGVHADAAEGTGCELSGRTSEDLRDQARRANIAAKFGRECLAASLVCFRH